MDFKPISEPLVMSMYNDKLSFQLSLVFPVEVVLLESFGNGPTKPLH